ncbi:MAG: hypothetical protein ABEH88_13240 [Halobacteriales archaeon]
MSIWGDAAQVAAGINIAILLALCTVWARNYRQFRSKHALGLLVFGVLMLAENGLALYFLAIDPMLMMEGVKQQAQTTLRLLMTAAFGFLAWITWD